MRKIIRLTESDLARIVRRVISEGTIGDSVFDNITKFIKTAGITNYYNKFPILDEIRKIKKCEDYSAFIARVEKRGFDHPTVWIRDTLKTNPSYDRSQSAYTTNPLKYLGTGLTDEEFNKDLGKLIQGLDSKCPSKK